MAISANSVWEIRTTATAANANGGFFVTGASGTDFSQQNAAQFNLTNVTTAAADAILLSASASANMVGNGAHIVSGTNFTVGWYEIISVVVGVSITLDRVCTSAAGALGVVNIGGAMSLASSDDAVFESTVAGNIMYVKTGSYTLGGTVNIGRSGSAALPIVIQGYQTTRGDRPTGTNAPTFTVGAVIFTLGPDWSVKNVNFVGTGTSVLTTAARTSIMYCRILNNSTTAARTGLMTGGLSNTIYKCDLQSYRGAALTVNTGTDVVVESCYIHDSDTGVAANASTIANTFLNNIFKNFVTGALKYNQSTALQTIIARNTFVGCNQTGVGITFLTGSTQARVYGNNISNFATGITHADAGNPCFDEYNNFFSNTTNTVNWTFGLGTITVNPGFSISDVTGTNGTTSGSVITSAGKDFTALGVTVGRDFIYIVSGTGITAGVYGITAVGTTTLTLDIAPGTNATADKVYQILRGADLTPGTNLLGVGTPSPFPAGYSTGYMDIGAVQKQQNTSTGGGSYGSS